MIDEPKIKVHRVVEFEGLGHPVGYFAFGHVDKMDFANSVAYEVLKRMDQNKRFNMDSYLSRTSHSTAGEKDLTKLKRREKITWFDGDGYDFQEAPNGH